MENLKERLADLESSFGQHKKQDWRLVIDLVLKLLSIYPNDVEINIRIIYMLHNILVEEEYTSSENYLIADLLKKCFNESYQKFSENPEYLFFIGKILYIAEWYFGIDDDLKPMEKKLAFKMQQKAFKKEPKNQLYKWAYVFSQDKKREAFILSKQILYGRKNWLYWLKKKGFPGTYLIEALEYCYENYRYTLNDG